jgi:hypothetical protein
MFACGIVTVGLRKQNMIMKEPDVPGLPPAIPATEFPVLFQHTFPTLLLAVLLFRVFALVESTEHRRAAGGPLAGHRY